MYDAETQENFDAVLEAVNDAIILANSEMETAEGFFQRRRTRPRMVTPAARPPAMQLPGRPTIVHDVLLPDEQHLVVVRDQMIPVAVLHPRHPCKPPNQVEVLSLEDDEEPEPPSADAEVILISSSSSQAFSSDSSSDEQEPPADQARRSQDRPPTPDIHPEDFAEPWLKPAIAQPSRSISPLLLSPTLSAAIRAAENRPRPRTPGCDEPCCSNTRRRTSTAPARTELAYQLPDGTVLKFPIGARRHRERVGDIRYDLRIDGITGRVRRVSAVRNYDATILGGYGGGGEYEVQLGFGWSNGLILDLLEKYGERLNVNNYFADPTVNTMNTVTVAIGVSTTGQIVTCILALLYPLL